MRALLLSLIAATSLAAQGGFQGKQGDYVAKNFTFTNGESLPELKIHYTTFGTPRKDAKGTVRNAVMILHGTGGTGRSFLSPTFAGQLFGPGQLLDSAKYYIVLPDGLGHGGSSKPSDGLRMKFPRYGYTDMVRAQYLLLTDGLGVNHLRLILGTSMGCMHSWVWAYTSPTFVDGLAPFACAPTQIAGRNRMSRAMIRDDIMGDPAWNGGNYTSPPVNGMRAAQQLLYLMGSAPLLQHRQAPTRDRADSLIRATINARLTTTDANDMLYYFDASSDYDPSSHLGEITTPILAINSADDFLNPPELHIVEPLIAKVKGAKFIMIPISDQTRGHGTHSLPSVWGGYLKDFLATLPER